ncbi:MAG: hypothetical protein R2788_26480 [Saprospiraceae bacterium]
MNTLNTFTTPFEGFNNVVTSYVVNGKDTSLPLTAIILSIQRIILYQNRNIQREQLLRTGLERFRLVHLQLCYWRPGILCWWAR